MYQPEDYSSTSDTEQSHPTDLYAVSGSSPPEPPVTADEAHAIGQAIASGADHLWQLLKRAEAGRVWEPLGLPDLPAFVARYVPAEQRRPLVAELRAEGMSIRSIAKATGVSKTQVGRDIEQVSPTGQLTPDALVLRNIDTVTGTDGKTYKASKPKQAKKPRKPTKAETHAQMVEMAEKIRAESVKRFETHSVQLL